MKWDDDSKEHLAPKHVWPVRSSGGITWVFSGVSGGDEAAKIWAVWDHHYHRSEISLVG